MEAVNERSLKKFGHGLQQILFTLRAQYQPLSLRGSLPRYPCLSRAHRVRNTPSLPSNSPDALQTPTRDGENRDRVSTR